MAELWIHTLPLTNALLSVPWRSVVMGLWIKCLQINESAMHADRFSITKAPSYQTREEKWKEKQVVLCGRSLSSPWR
jgi:hypothetical protein